MPPANSTMSTWVPAIFIFGLSVLIRLVFVSVHPIVYGGDSIMRMMHADRVLIAYQLPFLQLLIYGANLVSSDPLFLRYLMVVLGGLAGASFYGLSSILLGGEVAFVCALIFTVNPLVIVHSLVPYQEILMLLLLCSGLAFLFRGRTAGNEALASLCLGLACLTRYEAWIVTATALFWWKTQRGKASVRSFLKTLCLFAWAPLLWIGLQRGLSPAGTFVLEGFGEWQRLYRIPYILGMTVHHAGTWLGLAAVAGLVEFWRKSLWRNPRVQMLLLSAVAFLAALLFSAHGVPPDPVRYVTDREAHWLLLFLIWAGGLGLYQLRKYSTAIASREAANPPRALAAKAAYVGLVGICLIAGTYETQRRLSHLTGQPDLKLDFQVAKFLDRRLQDGKRALILAAPIPAPVFEDYFKRAHQKGGAAGLASAQRIVAEMDIGPFDYSRTVVNSRLGKLRTMSVSHVRRSSPGASFNKEALSGIGLVVRFSDFQPSDDWEVLLDAEVKQKGRKLTEITSPERTALIFELAG